MRIQSLVNLAVGVICWLVSYSGVLAQGQEKTDACLIVVISGFASDPSPKQLANESARGQGNSGMYQLAGDLTKAGFEATFFNWNGTRAGKVAQKNTPGTDGIVAFIRDHHASKQLKHLVLIGHSWGGHTLLEIAGQLKEDPQINISLAIGVDPSSLSRGVRVKKLPANIQIFVNYHTHNTFVWGPWRDDERIENIDLGNTKGRFAANNRRNYAAKFDINAHNAAEWDELIHSDIVKRIKNKIARPKSEAPIKKGK